MKTDYCSLNNAVAINAAPNAARHNPRIMQAGTLRVRDTNNAYQGGKSTETVLYSLIIEFSMQPKQFAMAVFYGYTRSI